MRRAITAATKAIPAVEKAKMTADEVLREEMSECVKRLAWPGEPGEKLKSCYRRVAKATGYTCGQIERLWSKERKVIPGTMLDYLRQKAAEHEAALKADFAAIQAEKNKLWPLTAYSLDSDFYSVRAAQDDPASDEVG